MSTPMITRRSMLTLAAAAGSAAVLARASTAAATGSVVLSGPQLAVGSNHNYFPAFSRAVPGACAVRIYYSEQDAIPAAWPGRLPGPQSLTGGPVIPPGTRTVLSLRPVAAHLLDGRLDSRIRAMCASAPAHSRLSVWPEAGPRNLADGKYPPWIDQATMHAMHARMMRLTRGTPVRYGSIICGPAEQIPGWLGDGLDWYGLDLYRFTRYVRGDGSTNWPRWETRMRNNLTAWQQAAGRPDPEIVVCETNAPRDQDRPAWFTTMAAWLARHSGGEPAMCTYWSTAVSHSGLSGPWPPSAATVGALRSITWRYAAERGWQ